MVQKVEDQKQIDKDIYLSVSVWNSMSEVWVWNNDVGIESWKIGVA